MYLAWGMATAWSGMDELARVVLRDVYGFGNNAWRSLGQWPGVCLYKALWQQLLPFCVPRLADGQFPIRHVTWSTPMIRRAFCWSLNQVGLRLFGEALIQWQTGIFHNTTDLSFVRQLLIPAVSSYISWSSVSAPSLCFKLFLRCPRCAIDQSVLIFSIIYLYFKPQMVGCHMKTVTAGVIGHVSAEV